MRTLKTLICYYSHVLVIFAGLNLVYHCCVLLCTDPVFRSVVVDEIIYHIVFLIFFPLMHL